MSLLARTRRSGRGHGQTYACGSCVHVGRWCGTRAGATACGCGGMWGGVAALEQHKQAPTETLRALAGGAWPVARRQQTERDAVLRSIHYERILAGRHTP
eukprot:5946432-Prymnesium_polylepis.2